MALNPKYVLAPSLQMYFVDKDNGLPMDGGKVYFYKDNTNVPKTVYELSGLAPDYSYTPLPNPVTLSAVGTFQDDDGNDILPYYYPYDDEGNIELYTIVVRDKDDVLQFTRSGWPNTQEGDVIADQDVTNFVPNGQFLLHNDIPASAANGYVVGKLSQDSTVIAPGGWVFVRGPGSTQSNILTFTALGPTQTPTGNPPFEVKLVSGGGSDTYKDFRIKFPNVNKFCSQTINYNLYFEGRSGTSSNVSNVEVIILKYYGSGGSATEELLQTTHTLTPGNSSFNTTLIFGNNAGKSVGSGGDDYVAIVIRIPPTEAQTVILTNFCMTINDSTLSSFPTQTNAQQISQSGAGFLPTPNPNGQDLYLPIVMAQTGFEFDRSIVGKIFASVTPLSGVSSTSNEIACDGTSVVRAAYSSLGIPYSRLFNLLYNNGNSLNVPIFGTGSNFVTTYQINSNTAQILLTTNTAGSVSATADGSPATGFTFTPVTTGQATTNYSAYKTASNTTLLLGNSVGIPNFRIQTIGTVGVTFNEIQVDSRNQSSASFYGFTLQAPSTGAGVTAGSAGTNYLKFSYVGQGSNFYYLWFKVDGAGTDPAPVNGVGIEINILSTHTAADISTMIMMAVQGFQQSTIICTAASAISQSARFTLSTATPATFNIWYNKDGGGTAPTGSNTNIEVAIAGSDTAAQVATKTIQSINSYQYAVPNFQGLFLRGYDPNQNWDINAASRFSSVATVQGNVLGTMELDEIMNHIHTVAVAIIQAPRSPDNTYEPGSANPITTSSTGGAETRPVNANVNYVIKY